MSNAPSPPHPRPTNGRSIYYVGLGELAVEVSFQMPWTVRSVKSSIRLPGTSPQKFSSSRATKGGKST